MRSSGKIKIYIATHKDFLGKVPPIYEPILVGSDINQSVHVRLQDNVGDNISAKNPSYCELTGLYWVWKNCNADIQGLVHYRRFFSGIKGRASYFGILGEGEVRHYLAANDILVIDEYEFKKQSVCEQYKTAHIKSDLIALRRVLTRKSPDYLPAFQKIMSGNKLVRYNMFIARKEVVHEYCEWLFPLLFDLESDIDISEYDAYQRRVFGFLAERLFTVWLEKQNLRIKYLPLRNIERGGRSRSIRLWANALVRRVFG